MKGPGTESFKTHRIHVWYIYLHLVNVGKYTSPMDPVGKRKGIKEDSDKGDPLEHPMIDGIDRD